jgi:hypothetical protein
MPWCVTRARRVLSDDAVASPRIGYSPYTRGGVVGWRVACAIVSMLQTLHAPSMSINHNLGNVIYAWCCSHATRHKGVSTCLGPLPHSRALHFHSPLNFHNLFARPI